MQKIPKGNPFNRVLFWPCYLWCAPWYGRTSYNQLTKYQYYLACGIRTRSYLSNYPSISKIYRALAPPKKIMSAHSLWSVSESRQISQTTWPRYSLGCRAFPRRGVGVTRCCPGSTDWGRVCRVPGGTAIIIITAAEVFILQLQLKALQGYKFSIAHTHTPGVYIYMCVCVPAYYVLLISFYSPLPCHNSRDWQRGIMGETVWVNSQ